MPPAFARMQAWQEEIRIAFWNKYHGKLLLSGPIFMEAEFYRGIPASAPKGTEALQRWMVRHIQTKPDRTNYLKAAEDALNGVVFVDDSHVVKGSEFKWYSRPGQPHYPGGYSVFRIREMAAGEMDGDGRRWTEAEMSETLQKLSCRVPSKGVGLRYVLGRVSFC